VLHRINSTPRSFRAFNSLTTVEGYTAKLLGGLRVSGNARDGFGNPVGATEKSPTLLRYTHGRTFAGEFHAIGVKKIFAGSSSP